MCFIVVLTLPGTPKLHPWTWIGWGAFKSIKDLVKTFNIDLGVIPYFLFFSSRSSSLWLNLKALIPPGFTILTPRPFVELCIH